MVLPKIKHSLLLLIVITLLGNIMLICPYLFAQLPSSDLEVFLADFTILDDKIELDNLQNVSINEGYDNQPWFSSDGETLLYTSNRGGETDIISLSVNSLEKIWLTETPNRSEYSPQFRPNTEELSYITLSKDGIQDFRNLELTVKNGQLGKIETILEKESIIGYYHWFNRDSYLCFVLPTDEKTSTLQWHNFSNHTDSTDKSIILNMPGRSFLPIPNTEYLSFIDKRTTPWQIMSFDPLTLNINSIFDVLDQSEDFAWLPNGYPVMGSGSILMYHNGHKWSVLGDLFDTGITNITRLAINGESKKIAIVGELIINN
jgi:hypothetical protein